MKDQQQYLGTLAKNVQSQKLAMARTSSLDRILQALQKPKQDGSPYNSKNSNQLYNEIAFADNQLQKNQLLQQNQAMQGQAFQNANQKEQNNSLGQNYNNTLQDKTNSQNSITYQITKSNQKHKTLDYQQLQQQQLFMMQSNSRTQFSNQQQINNGDGQTLFQSMKNSIKIVRPKMKEGIVSNGMVKQYQSQKQLNPYVQPITTAQQELVYMKTQQGFQVSKLKNKSNPYLRKQNARAFSQQKRKIQDLLNHVYKSKQQQKSGPQSRSITPENQRPQGREKAQNKDQKKSNKDLQIVSENQEENSQCELLDIEQIRDLRRQQSHQDQRGAFHKTQSISTTGQSIQIGNNHQESQSDNVLKIFSKPNIQGKFFETFSREGFLSNEEGLRIQQVQIGNTMQKRQINIAHTNIANQLKHLSEEQRQSALKFLTLQNTFQTVKPQSQSSNNRPIRSIAQFQPLSTQNKTKNQEPLISEKQDHQMFGTRMSIKPQDSKNPQQSRNSLTIHSLNPQRTNSGYNINGIYIQKNPNTNNQDELISLNESSICQNLDEPTLIKDDESIIDFNNLQKQMTKGLQLIEQGIKLNQGLPNTRLKEEMELRMIKKMYQQNIGFKIDSKTSRTTSKTLKILSGVALISALALFGVYQFQETLIDSHYTINTFDQDMYSPIMKEYMNFLAQYQKTYASIHDIKDRYMKFKRNFEAIMKHNADEEQTFEMGINEYSDLTEEEFQKQMISGVLIRPEHAARVKSLPDPDEEKILLRGEAKNINVPDEVNWYKEGKVTRPYNQASCGACWAFSAISALESLALISGTVSSLKELSVQQLVDCDEVNFACGGGWMYDAFAYVLHNGVALNDGYPRKYSARRMGCNYRPAQQEYFRNTGMIEEDGNTNQRMKELVSKQPISIAMFTPGMLQSYKKGVVTEDYLKCSSLRNEVNHGILLVGYGKVKPGEKKVRGKCQEYWIIRNSWGGNWGEEGFFRICMDKAGAKDRKYGACLVNKFATWPNMDGEIIAPTD
ncbi:gut cathepsin l-like cysteine protease [Stylonychia lemnae]|uniref:Gut cathepsin l-like cysteine protease n=1 Tax=Stylonychia lemnae TaxID=5949 RepID=A0A078A9H0_STYLE|nr:gut cathepsin l-like cysteine protease [Stylonychia lemnae]|eukprot:CDW78905.1 gut cathepsin l-like cysteine protease [Stylonychia lemnae]